MKVTEAKYSIRRTLAQYEHEEISITLCQSIEGEATGDEMIKEARRIAVTHTTEYLKKQKLEQSAKGQQ